MSLTIRQLIRQHHAGTLKRPLAAHIAEARVETVLTREALAKNLAWGFNDEYTRKAPETAAKLDAIARALLFTLMGYDESDPDFPDISDL